LVKLYIEKIHKNAGRQTQAETASQKICYR